MTMMTNPIVDQGQVLAVKPIMNDRADDLMNDNITLMSKSANDNKRDTITVNPCALLTAFQEDLRRLKIRVSLLRNAFRQDSKPGRSSFVPEARSV